MNQMKLTGNNYHLLTGPEGNSVFCDPETADVSRGGAEGNIGGRGITKYTVSRGIQSISVLLYTRCQRKNLHDKISFIYSYKCQNTRGREATQLPVAMFQGNNFNVTRCQ